MWTESKTSPRSLPSPTTRARSPSVLKRQDINFVWALRIGILFRMVDAILKTHPVGTLRCLGEFMFELASRCSVTVDGITCLISFPLARGTMALLEWIVLSYHASNATMTFSRLRCDQSHAPDGYQFGVQDIYHVPDSQHWSDFARRVWGNWMSSLVLSPKTRGRHTSIGDRNYVRLLSLT